MKRRLHPNLFRQRYKQYKQKPVVSSSTLSVSRKKRLLLRPRPPLSAPLKKGLVIFTIAAIVIGGTYLTFFSQFFRIQEIRIEENHETVLGTSSLRQILESFLGKHLFFTNLQETERDIVKANLGTFQSVILQRKFPDKILLQYSSFPRVANLLFVQKDVPRKFLVNNQGVLVEQDIEDPNLPYIRLMQPEDKEYGVGEEAIPADYLEKMSAAYAMFVDRFGMLVPEVLYLPVEREAHLKTERQFLIWLDLEKDVLDQLSKLKQALPKLDIYKENLSYIDLRISGSSEGGEKIIFKRQ